MTTNTSIITPQQKADYVLTPDFYMFVDAPCDTNESIVTMLIPGDNPYIIRFNRNSGKFYRNGIKETKAHFNAFVQRVIAMTPAWHPESDPEKVLFNTLERAAHCDKLAATFAIDHNYTPETYCYPIKVSRTDSKQQARVRVNITDTDIVHPPYQPSHVLYNINFHLDIVVDETFYPDFYNASFHDDKKRSSLLVQSGFSFRGNVKIIASNKSPFVHFPVTHLHTLPIIQKIFGIRDVDIQSLIIRTIANGGSYSNDGTPSEDPVEVNACSYSTLMEAMEKYGVDFIRNLEKLDSNKKSSAA